MGTTPFRAMSNTEEWGVVLVIQELAHSIILRNPLTEAKKSNKSRKIVKNCIEEMYKTIHNRAANKHIWVITLNIIPWALKEP